MSRRLRHPLQARPRPLAPQPPPQPECGCPSSLCTSPFCSRKSDPTTSPLECSRGGASLDHSRFLRRWGPSMFRGRGCPPFGLLKLRARLSIGIALVSGALVVGVGSAAAADPVLTLPGTIVAEATDATGANVTYSASAAN